MSEPEALRSPPGADMISSPKGADHAVRLDQSRRRLPPPRLAMQDAGISVTRKGPDETLSCAAVPEFKFRLVDA